MVKCVRCGTMNPDVIRFCGECGKELYNRRETVKPEIWREKWHTALQDERQTTVEPGQTNALNEGNHATQTLDYSAAIENFEPSPAAKLFDDQQTPLSNTAHARLVVERGTSAGKAFALIENECSIGRWDADNGIFPDVDLDAEDAEAKVSRRHARILRRGDDYLIEDVGSTNGTYVNRGRRLAPGRRQILQDGDEIIVGKTFLRFQIVRDEG